MHNRLIFIWLLLPLLGRGASSLASDDITFGPLYQDFDLTLAPGHRAEALGPFFYSERRDTSRTWAIPPLFSKTWDPATESVEMDFAYPVLTYDRYGGEYRFQFFQLFSFAGGMSYSETNVSRFTLFPVFFMQRSAIPERNYTAVVPFYGQLQNRLFRDEVNFIMMPIYVQSRKRDVVTDNYVYPFFHLRHGDGLEGWQFWPFVGEEQKAVTWQTNKWGDVVIVGGHKRVFAVWPFYAEVQSGLGTVNPASQLAVIPFYARLRSPLRDSTSYLWPIGHTHTIDREKKYEEWDAPWPLIVFARGEGKQTDRVWPFFSHAQSQTLENNWYAWPIYQYRRINAPPLDRRRTKILFFLYSDRIEKNTDTSEASRRIDAWPLFTWRRDFNGDKQLQVLSILEPFFPTSKSIERDYSQLWSLWRSQKSVETGATSQSLLWNLYRREMTPEEKKFSLLFGLFQYRSTPNVKKWRILYIPLG